MADDRISIRLTTIPQATSDLPNAWRWIKAMLFSGRRVLLEARTETRSAKQNRVMWSCLTDLSNQVTWFGKKLTKEGWKDFITGHLDGQDLVPTEQSDFTGRLMMTDKNLSEKRSSRVQVLEAVHALNDQEMEINVSALVRHTGLKVVTVNDCIKELKERGDIFSPARGIYKPSLRHEPSESVILIAMPTGHVKLEKGDTVMEFTPHEWRLQVAPFAAGASAQTAVIEATHHTLQLLEQVRKLQRQVDGLRTVIATNPAQLALLEAA